MLFRSRIEPIHSQPPAHPEKERAPCLSIMPPSMLAPLKTAIVEVKEHAPEDSGPAVDEVALRLAAAIEEIGALRPHLFAQAEAQMVDLAALIARRVIGRELATDPTLLLGLVKEAVLALSERDRIVVRIGRSESGDGSWEAAFARRLAESLPAAEVLFDPDLGEGGCVLESDVGQVDASVSVRLEAILASLGGVRQW